MHRRSVKVSNEKEYMMGRDLYFLIPEAKLSSLEQAE